MSLIFEYLSRRGHTPRWQGKWGCSDCPACGGDDRFHFLCQEGREWFECRGCGARGNAIDYLIKFEGMDYREAQHAVRDQHAGEETPRHPANVFDDYAKWHAAVAIIARDAAENLQSNDEAQTALEAKRGINRATAEFFGVGYIDNDAFYDRSELGLPSKFDTDGGEMRLCRPAGITIPIRKNGELCGLTIRRDKPYQGQRYSTIPGSRLEPMAIVGIREDVVIVVESFLCGMLIWQDTGETVVALGTASIMPTGDVAALLRRAKVVLVALDTDEAGARQFYLKWLDSYATAVRCPIPPAYGKDPTEARCNGLILREWLDAGILMAREARGIQIPPLDEIELGGLRARVELVATRAVAQAIATRISSECSAIGVAIEIESIPQYAAHPQAAWHPQFTKVKRLAVYAKSLNLLFVIDMTTVTHEDIDAIWDVDRVIAHDGVELLSHFGALHQRQRKVESTLLMANALHNQRLTLSEALSHFADTSLPPENGNAGSAVAYKALALGTLHGSLVMRLKEEKLWKLYRRMRNVQNVFAALQRNGMGFNTDACQDAVHLLQTHLAEVQGTLPPELHDADDLAIRRWLNTSLSNEALTGWKRLGDGELSISDRALAACELPHANTLRDVRRIEGLRCALASLLGFVCPESSRIRASYQIGGCLTGRASCRLPALHNIPRDPLCRSLFQPAAGAKLVVADVAQSQLRILAQLSGDPVMLDAYARGLDLHTLTAALVMHVPVEEVTPEQRRAAKAMNFGLIYGQGAEGFRNQALRDYGVELSIEEATRFRGEFFATYSGLAERNRAVAAFAKRRRTCHALGGRLRLLSERDGNKLRKVLPFGPQATEADIMLDALSGMYPELLTLGGTLVHFVHDEVIIEAPDDDDTLSAVCDTVERHICGAFQRMFPGASVGGLVKTKVVTNWAEAR